MFRYPFLQYSHITERAVKKEGLDYSYRDFAQMRIQEITEEDQKLD